MVYSGGPFVTIGTITDLGESVGPINIPYSRLTDALDLILAGTAEYNSYVPWEWWFDYTGALQVAQTRGTDKSASVTLEASIHIGRATKSSSSRQTSQRVRTVGRGESAEQDQNTSDWWDNATEMANVGTFYEKLDVEKELSDKDKADVWSQIILEQEAPLRQEITVVLENDLYTVNDFDVGDTVTVTDPDVNLSGKYRVKTIEKTVTNNGETTTVTLSNVRTDISDRLADFAKTLEKMQYSSTYIDVVYAEGSRQRKLAADKIEDVWEQTASNKYAITLAEEETDEPNLEMCDATLPSYTSIDFECKKEEFVIWTPSDYGWGFVYLKEPLVKFSRNPRFTCEFEVDTTSGKGEQWADFDYAYIRMVDRWGLCVGGANDAKYCCVPYTNFLCFGFKIHHDDGTLQLSAELNDGVNHPEIKIANIAEDIKYMIEARVEWKERVVKFYFGKSNVEELDSDWEELGFRLRAILPLDKDALDTDTLMPFTAYMEDGDTTTKLALYIYRYTAQAMKSVEKQQHV